MKAKDRELIMGVKDFLIAKQVEGKSRHTLVFYGDNLRRFLWYAEQQEWPDDVRLITEWYIREFLAYTGGEGNRWGLTGNGAESSRPTAITAPFATTGAWLRKTILYLKPWSQRNNLETLYIWKRYCRNMRYCYHSRLS